MSDAGAGTPSVGDVLTGRRQHDALTKITPGQRLYYNYRLDQPSFAAEIANLGAPPAPHDLRSRRQRGEDA